MSTILSNSEDHSKKHELNKPDKREDWTSEEKYDWDNENQTILLEI